MLISVVHKLLLINELEQEVVLRAINDDLVSDLLVQEVPSCQSGSTAYF